MAQSGHSRNHHDMNSKDGDISRAHQGRADNRKLAPEIKLCNGPVDLANNHTTNTRLYIVPLLLSKKTHHHPHPQVSSGIFRTRTLQKSNIHHHPHPSKNLPGRSGK
ncbi:uncharacterized protein P884DRAFT_8974 [Thermothelomyces heterothallicus CBS 202.75]|uniref:uncharacterized protein n=1 Tax=Thermothelomyces heterothallicus CBS 202.75 TaxID=1149848 RepID=UPI0037433FCD